MSFELTGKLINLGTTQQVTDSFQKREFVIEVTETGANGTDYTNYIKLQLLQNKCDLLEAFSLNTEVKVNFNIKGRKWEKDGKVNYFNSLDCWRIEGTNQAPVQDTPEQPPHNIAIDEGLPF